MHEIVLANAALALLEKLLPIIAERVKSGQVTPSQQTDLRKRYTALRAAGDAAFTGPEWEVEARSPA